MITYEEKQHKYWIDDIEAISVNKLIRSFGIGVDIESLPPTARQNFENARIRGKYAHLMAQYFFQDQLDETTIDPQFQPYLEALKKIKVDYEVEPLAIEERIGFKNLLVAGTPDIRGMFKGTHRFADWKFTYDCSKKTHLQLGRYRYINNMNVEKPEDMIGPGIIFHINPKKYKDKGYKAIDEDFDAENEFKSLLIAHHVRSKYL